MKKIFNLLMIFTLLFSLTACQDNNNSNDTDNNLDNQGHVHTFDSKVIDPTCEAYGYTQYTCSDCGYQYSDTVVDALNHDFDLFISETTSLETEEGVEVYMCSKCEKKNYSLDSSINTVDKGVNYFYLGANNANKFKVEAIEGYTSDSFVLNVSDLIDSHFTGSLYYTFNPDYGLFYHDAFKFDFTSEGDTSEYTFENGKFDVKISEAVNFKYNKENNQIKFTITYSNYGVNSSEALGNFAFYLVINSRDVSYEYKNINPYVLPMYSQTWIKVNKENKFYYTTKYQDFVCEDWSRPDIAPSIEERETNWTHCCRAETPEEVIVSTLIAEEQGATNVDFNLQYLKPIYLNHDDLAKIFKTFKNIGTIAVYYSGYGGVSLSQEERLATLKLAVEAGCGGVDLQGFMFHEGSTRTTHTEENIRYWEERGFDMSFIKASPAETTIDPEEDAKQIAYIEEIHALGGKVLQSTHVGVEFTRKQALAYGKFIDHRNVDIIKIVSTASNQEAFEGTILSNVDAYNAYKNGEMKGRYSIHCTNNANTDISRVIGPLFYHAFMAFHYNYLCKLQMVMEIKNSGIELSDSIAIKDAIKLIEGRSKDPELQYLIDQNKTLNSNMAYGYGKDSNLSNKWSFNGENTTVLLKEASGSNKFPFRGIAYSANNYSNDFEYETTISGNFKPYSSSARLPKVGIFIGDRDNMLALTYTFKTNSSGVGTAFAVGLYSNSSYFGTDVQGEDSLKTLVPNTNSITVNSNICNNDVIRLKVKYVNGNLSIYYSTNASGEYTLIQTLEYDQVKDYFTHDSQNRTYFGNVAEVYMGSESSGIDNIIYFTNKRTK